MRRKLRLLMIVVFTLCGTMSLYSCSDDNDDLEDTSNEITEEDYSDWSEATHTKNVDPNYDVVFDDESVMRLDIVIDSDKWEAMQSNLATLLGSSNNIGGPQGGQGGPIQGGPGQGGQIGGQETDEAGYVQNVSFDNPDWADCSLFYNGIEWYHVGIRYKGNSSLQRAYQSGSKKLSFKFDFDQYEDDYPDLKNQRFYGFKQLNLNNNFEDQSLMREKVTADLFRSFGVVAPHTRFCAVYVNHGEGLEFYGVYALVEEVDDTVLEDQFGDDDGNLYKPDGNAASFGKDTYSEEQFVKKSNEDEADYSDVLALYNALNDDETRESDSITWASNLEKIINMPKFLKWLAANTVMQNWDTYGNMTHNYYLYNDPSTGLLNWIPWDNNEALYDDNRSLSLSLSEVSNLWPLINYVMTQDKYKNEYEAYLKSFVDDVYTSDTMNTLYDKYYTLLKDYATEEGNTNFLNAVSTLRSHVNSRTTAVSTYLSE